jgi:hypothetical protein
LAHQSGGPGSILVRPRLADEKWDLVVRVAESRHFQRSARLRDFLFYVASRVLDEPGVAIHEQEIAVHVFGRDVDSASSEDTIVRVHASQLRKRLQEYFSSEGVQENTVIEIPRGNYAPVFKAREPAPVPRQPHKRLHAALFGIIAGLSLFCGWLLFVNAGLRRDSRPGASLAPVTRQFWSQFSRPGQRLDIVLADSNLSLVQDLLKRPIGLNEYVNRTYFSRIDAIPDPVLRMGARDIMMRQHTSLADANLQRKILRLTGDAELTSVIFARDFHARHMKTDNVILFGSRRSNPWVELVEEQLNFRFVFDEVSGAAVIENRVPRAGEQPQYRAVRGSGTGALSYCLIACVPNLSRTGSMLVVAGTEMEGTEAGGEFMTSERWLAHLRQRLQPAGTDVFPYFEVLLKNSKVGGTSRGFEVVAWRIPKP